MVEVNEMVKEVLEHIAYVCEDTTDVPVMIPEPADPDGGRKLRDIKKVVNKLLQKLEE